MKMKTVNSLDVENPKNFLKRKEYAYSYSEIHCRDVVSLGKFIDDIMFGMLRGKMFRSRGQFSLQQCGTAVDEFFCLRDLEYTPEGIL